MKKRHTIYYCGGIMSHDIGYNYNLLKHFHRYLCLLYWD